MTATLGRIALRIILQTKKGSLGRRTMKRILFFCIAAAALCGAEGEKPRNSETNHCICKFVFDMQYVLSIFLASRCSDYTRLSVCASLLITPLFD